jgi:hypothetical protein
MRTYVLSELQATLLKRMMRDCAPAHDSIFYPQWVDLRRVVRDADVIENAKRAATKRAVREADQVV